MEQTTVYQCQDCGHTWVPRPCSYCGAPSDLWYPIGSGNDDSEGHCLELCVNCAVRVVKELTELTSSVLADKIASAQASTRSTPTGANRAARRHPTTAIPRRARRKAAQHA